MYCSLPGDGYRGSCADNPELSNVPSINEARSSSKHSFASFNYCQKFCRILQASHIARNSAFLLLLLQASRIAGNSALFLLFRCKLHLLPEILSYFASFIYCQKFCLILQASSIARNTAFSVSAFPVDSTSFLSQIPFRHRATSVSVNKTFSYGLMAHAWS